METVRGYIYQIAPICFLTYQPEFFGSVLPQAIRTPFRALGFNCHRRFPVFSNAFLSLRLQLIGKYWPNLFSKDLLNGFYYFYADFAQTFLL